MHIFLFLCNLNKIQWNKCESIFLFWLWRQWIKTINSYLFFYLYKHTSLFFIFFTFYFLFFIFFIFLGWAQLSPCGLDSASPAWSLAQASDLAGLSNTRSLTLDCHSSPCVFWGYSSSHLGYRCLDFASQRIYVSRHVHFHESVFPFTALEQIAHPPSHSLPPHTLPTLITSHQTLHPTALSRLQLHQNSPTVHHPCLPPYHGHPAIPLCHHLHVFFMIIM
jgi:hypothetical protein